MTILGLTSTEWTAVAAVAQAVAAFGALLVFVVAVLQRSDARDAAAAAMRAAVAAEASVTAQNAAQEEQSRLTVFPPLGCEFTGWPAAPSVRIFNPGDYPALDVDLAILQVLWEDDMSVSDYVDRYLKSEYRGEVASMDTTIDGSFAIADHIIYSAVPPRRAVEAPLSFATEAEQFVTLLQYRDVQGRNYQQLLNTGWSRTDGRYTTYLSQDGRRLDEVVRLEVFGISEPNDGDASEDVRREFFGLWRYMFPVGYLAKPRAEIEDRGTWSDL